MVFPKKTALHWNRKERKMKSNSLLLINDVPAEVVITSGEELKKTEEMNTKLQQSIKIVEALYKEPKAAANAAHKAITAKEKELLAPLKAYKALNDKAISDYHLALEEKARAEAEAKEKEKQEYLAELGDSPFAALNTLEADKPAPIPKVETADNITVIDDYEIEVINPLKVPIVVDGTIVRGVDVGAIKKIVKKHSGMIEIEGIKITKKKQVRTRVL